MGKLWIPEKLEILKRLRDKCGVRENALVRYIGCMIRMLNGLAQMEYSQFHFYERKILWNASEIFTQQFIEQVEIARREEDVIKKRVLIDDIENAVDRMTGVYKNVIDSTANSDRQILSSISIDTSIYELSPKICAFYSMILNKLVEMFEGNNAEYAFVLHPTLKNNTETRIMFEHRKKSGKVVIIYISESIIEMFDVVSVFILHEAFHVLTKEERKRKFRIRSFITLMLSGMRQELFKNVIFNEDTSRNKKIEERLLQQFFSDIKEEAIRWNEKEENSREFYGRNVRQWVNGYFKRSMKNINGSLEKWVRETMSETISGKNYEEFYKGCEKEDRVINQIQDNLSEAMFENRELSLSDHFLFLCREIYADIACILILQLDPNEYEKAFEESKQFYSDEKKYYDSTRIVRNFIVARTVAVYMPVEKSGSWNEYVNMLSGCLKKERYAIKREKLESSSFSEKDLAFSKSCVILDITPQMRAALFGYAKECADALNTRLESVEDIQPFRKFMFKVRKNDNRDWIMRKIMIGDFGEIF